MPESKDKIEDIWKISDKLLLLKINKGYSNTF